MNGIRAIQKLNQRELEEGIAPEASWHTDYRDTAFIYIGGLPFELSEGDIVTIFSQYGEPVWVRLARDRETGKSRGFAWLKYEDQRSTDLAVDNLGGATIMDRMLRVDHTRYQPKDDEDMRDNTMGDPDAVENGARKKRLDDSQSESEDERPMLKEEIELEKLMNSLDDDDPMKASMVKRKREEADAAVAKHDKARRREKERAKRHQSRRHHRDRSDSRDRHRDRGRDRDEGRDRERVRDASDNERRRDRHSHRHRQSHKSEDHDRRDRRRYSPGEDDRHRSDDEKRRRRTHRD